MTRRWFQGALTIGNDNVTVARLRTVTTTNVLIVGICRRRCHDLRGRLGTLLSFAKKSPGLIFAVILPRWALALLFEKIPAGIFALMSSGVTKATGTPGKC
jgi:hypothetical protein